MLDSNLDLILRAVNNRQVTINDISNLFEKDIEETNMLFNRYIAESVSIVGSACEAANDGSAWGFAAVYCTQTVYASSMVYEYFLNLKYSGKK
jgi:hypothetical protein